MPPTGLGILTRQYRLCLFRFLLFLLGVIMCLISNQGPRAARYSTSQVDDFRFQTPVDLRAVILSPAPNRRVIDGQTPLRHQFFQIAETQRTATAAGHDFMSATVSNLKLQHFRLPQKNFTSAGLFVDGSALRARPTCPSRSILESTVLALWL